MALPSEIQRQSDAVLSAADGITPEMAVAFTQAIAQLKDDIDIDELADALYNNDLNRALQVMGIDTMDDLLFGIGMGPNAYIYSGVIHTAFFAGAQVALKNLSPELQRLLSFDPLGERAVQILRRKALDSARELTLATKAGVRQSIVDSQSLNLTIPQRAAQIRDLIGLTNSQMKAVLNFRRQLETRQLLNFTPPDERRLSAVEAAMVRRHMREGTFSQSQINQMTDTYYERLLNKRAMDIARTESLHAVNEGQQEMWEQGLDAGVFDDNEDRKYWIVTHDDKLRPTHAAIPGMNPNGVKIRSMFVTPFGMVSSPGDANVGLINCRCTIVLGQISNSSWYRV